MQKVLIGYFKAKERFFECWPVLLICINGQLRVNLTTLYNDSIGSVIQVFVNDLASGSSYTAQTSMKKKNCHLFIGDELLWLNTCSDFYRYCVKLGVYTGWRIIWAWCSQRWTHKQNLYNNRKVHRHFWRGFFFSTWSWTFIKEFFSPTCCFK